MKNSRGIFTLFFTVLLCCSCSKQYLTGYYSQAEFMEACHWKTKVNEKYEPKEKFMDSLATIKTKVDLQVYLGTYCPDSKRIIPKLFKILPDLPVQNVEIISVDTTKRDEKGWALAKGIKKIPTIIFYVEGEEVGRIVEKTKGRIEKRFFRICKNI